MKRLALVLVTLVAAGCGGSSICSSALTNDGSSMCRHAAGVDNGCPGACRVGRHYLICENPSGDGFNCFSDGDTCVGAPFPNLKCTNQCAANEYALACGCGGGPQADMIVCASAPDGCRIVAGPPGETVYSCCPCL